MCNRETHMLIQAVLLSRNGHPAAELMQRSSVMSSNMIFVLFVTCFFGVITTVSSEFSGECLFAHNKARSQHEDTPNLVWDESLADLATKYAMELQRRNKASSSSRYDIDHSSAAGHDYGENIYAGNDGGFNERKIAHAMYFWYREGVGYNYNSLAPWVYTNHFTQVVWKSTTSVGCGKTIYFKDMKVHTILVCQYKPKGNTGVHFTRNVKRLKGGGTEHLSVADLTGVESSVPAGSGCSYTDAVPQACKGMKAYCNDASNKFLTDYLQKNCKKTCNC